jgi:hypothetical protein
MRAFADFVCLGRGFFSVLQIEEELSLIVSGVEL